MAATMALPADVAARAFEPFFTTKGRGKGTGLGLTTVLALAQRSGGHARLDSELGAGTTVSLFLPQAEGRAAIPAEPAVQSRGETVVLVEGEPTIRDLVTTELREVLAGAPYRATAVGTLRAGPT